MAFLDLSHFLLFWQRSIVEILEGLLGQITFLGRFLGHGIISRQGMWRLHWFQKKLTCCRIQQRVRNWVIPPLILRVLRLLNIVQQPRLFKKKIFRCPRRVSQRDNSARISWDTTDMIQATRRSSATDFHFFNPVWFNSTDQMGKGQVLPHCHWDHVLRSESRLSNEILNPVSNIF